MRLLILHEQATLWLSSIQDSAIIYLFYYVQSSLNNMVVIHHPTLTHTKLSIYYTISFSFMELRTLSLWTVKHSTAVFNKNGYFYSNREGHVLFASIVCGFSFISASGRQFYLSRRPLLNCSFYMGCKMYSFLRANGSLFVSISKNVVATDIQNESFN